MLNVRKSITLVKSKNVEQIVLLTNDTFNSLISSTYLYMEKRLYLIRII